MTTILPVWLSVTYAETSDYHATLRISANNAANLSISVAHEGVVELTGYAMAGNGSIDGLVVQDNETLLIVVRNDHSEIIACGLYEVNLDLIEQLSAVLVPCVSSNLIVDQTPQRTIDRAVTRALVAACGVATGELVAEEVAR